MSSATAPRPARLLALVAAALACALGGGALAGCELLGQHDAEYQGDDALEPSDPGPECNDAADCVLASSSCCTCPAFALPASSGWGDSCEDVMCPTPPVEDCGNVAAVCERGACTLACVVVECDQICDSNFAVDAAGCLICACGGGSVAAECSVDADCAQVPGDCCGCARGGLDTAVPVSEVASFDAQLDCSSDDNEACPGVDVCDPEATARCVLGNCTLAVPPMSEDADAGVYPPTKVQPCGTTANLPCPDGWVCVLNDPEANDNGFDGVGICVAQ